MEIKIDFKADAMYIRFQKGKFAKNKVIDEDTIIDFDEKGRILGIEIPNVTKKIPIEYLSNVSVKIPIKREKLIS
jgi:uncharacterized protein YuzE